jgi:hypothetical protein
MTEPKWFTCSICGKSALGWGNNPQPVRENFDDRCCDDCDATIVIPTRIALYAKGRIDSE